MNRLTNFDFSFIIPGSKKVNVSFFRNVFLYQIQYVYYQNNSKILTMTEFLLGHALKVTCLGFVCLLCNQPVSQANTDQFFSKRAFEPGTYYILTHSFYEPIFSQKTMQKNIREILCKFLVRTLQYFF